MVKLVDTRDLKSLAARHTGSIPVPGTKQNPHNNGVFVLPESNRKGLGKLLSGFPTFAGESSREGGSPFVGVSETNDVRFLPG